MKKLIVLITTLVVAATLGGAAAAYAEETDETAYMQTYYGTTDGELYYPKFVSVLDIEVDCYAVSGDTFAIADGRSLYIYSDSVQDGYTYDSGTLESCSFSFTIADLYYDSDGTLYIYDGTSTYLYSDGSATIYDGNLSFFPQAEQTIVLDNLVILVNDGQLSLWDRKTSTASLSDGTYSALKQIGDKIYVIKDRQLCLVEGSTPDEVTVNGLTFEYTDFSYGSSIAIGDCAELLKTTADSTEYVVIPEGQYVTRIDISDLSGTYFKTIEKNGAHTFSLESNMTALVLCTSGNAMIVVVDDEAYITYNTGERYSWTQSVAPFTGGQLLMEAGLYSSPYISDSTRIATLAVGATVSVLYELSAEIGGEQVLEANFCRVSYTDDNGNMTVGYVATGFLTAYEYVIPTEDDLTAEWNDDYSEENVILTVVLTIVIVVLVIAGVAYLAYFSGSNRRNQKKLNAEDDEDDNYSGGYGNDSYNNGGYNSGYNNGGYNSGGYNSGYGNDGYNNGGYNSNGYNSGGYNGNNGYNNGGYNSNGYNSGGYNGNNGYNNGNGYGNGDDGRYDE